MDFVSPSCLVKAYNVGSTSITNICNGKIEVVHWGQLDWVSNGVWVLGAVCVSAFLISLAVAAFKTNAIQIEIKDKKLTA